MLSIVRALFAALLLAATPAVAQAPVAPPPAPETSAATLPLDTSSPSATFASFVALAGALEAEYQDYTSDKTLAKALSMRHDIQRIHQLMDLSTLPPATRLKAGNAALGYMLDILARLPPINPATIPGADGTDPAKLPPRWTVPGTDIRIARVTSGPRTGEYLFTSDSIAALPEIYDQIIRNPPLRPTLYPSFYQEQINITGPLFSSGWTKSLPPALRRPILDTPLWKILTAACAFVLIVIATFFWARLANRLAGSHDDAPVRRLWWRLTTPLVLLVLLAAGFMLTDQIYLAGTFAAIESVVAAAIAYSVLAWAAWIGCFFLVEAIIASPKIPDNSYDAHLLRLAARVAALLSAGTILVFGANDIGIPALGLVAGLGVGGFALALASQSTLENLFGGLSIFADRPFRIGDSITYGAGAGTVEIIGPRSSRIRAAEGALITVPNSDLAKMHITNFSMRNRCLFLQTLSLRSDTPPEQLRSLLQRLRALIATEPLVETGPGWPRITVTGISNNAVAVEVRAHVMTSDYNVFVEIQERLIFDVLDIVDTLGIEQAVTVPVAKS